MERLGVHGVCVCGCVFVGGVVDFLMTDRVAVTSNQKTGSMFYEVLCFPSSTLRYRTYFSSGSDALLVDLHLLSEGTLSASGIIRRFVKLLLVVVVF